MDKVEININGKWYTVEVADTPEKRSEGLQNRSSLGRDDGMIFLFDDEDIDEGIAMWMKDTHIPLDIIFINDEWEVVRVAQGEPLSENLIHSDEAIYVLELHQNSGIQVGDYVDLIELLEDYDVELPEDEDEEESESEELLVIDEKGNVQMTLKGGERIFSRKNTATLIKMAKRAYVNKSDRDYKALGNKVFKYLNQQDEKDPDFVQLPS